MVYLLLAIAFNVYLILVFRYFYRFGINNFHAIVSNYFVCIGMSILFFPKGQGFEKLELTADWSLLSLLTGCFFPFSFYLMALSIEKVSISVASIATKMSLVIPVVFNFMFLQLGNRDMSAINIIGIFLAFPAIAFSSLTGNTLPDKENSRYAILLPLMAFIISGSLDTMINYISFMYLDPDKALFFPFFTFTAAAAMGSLLVLVRVLTINEKIEYKSLLAGIVLGIPNYFSIYFVLQSLAWYEHDGAFVYPVLNIAVIIVTSLLSVLLFKEKLTRVNVAGIILAVISIGLVFLNWRLFMKQLNLLD